MSPEQDFFAATGSLPARAWLCGARVRQALRSDQSSWAIGEIRQRMEFGLRTAFAWGSRAVNTHVDWPDAGTPLALPVIESLRESWHGRIDPHFTAQSDTARLADAARATQIATSLRRCTADERSLA